MCADRQTPETSPHSLKRISCNRAGRDDLDKRKAYSVNQPFGLVVGVWGRESPKEAAWGCLARAATIDEGTDRPAGEKRAGFEGNPSAQFLACQRTLIAASGCQGNWWLEEKRGVSTWPGDGVNPAGHRDLSRQVRGYFMPDFVPRGQVRLDCVRDSGGTVFTVTRGCRAASQGVNCPPSEKSSRGDQSTTGPMVLLSALLRSLSLSR